MRDEFSLSELLVRVKEVVARALPGKVWVRAEIHSVSRPASGHCYLELVEKGSGRGAMFKAKATAAIWANRWSVLRPYFREATGRELQEGMAVLVCVRVSFSELYGMNLTVEDIDPTYTLGEVELRRKQTIDRLVKEGMLDMNKELPMPKVLKRLAVVSAEGAAGFGDFMKSLQESRFDVRVTLYPAPMQGDAAAEGIIVAMEQIHADVEYGVMNEVQCVDGAGLFAAGEAGGSVGYDAVLILRGGGSVADLACFDDYELAVNIAQFPLPVLVAVGHERDTHVCDMVAAVSVKTPTALAGFVLDGFSEALSYIDNMCEEVKSALRERFMNERMRTDRVAQRAASASLLRCRTGKAALGATAAKLSLVLRNRFRTGALELEQMKRRLLPAVHYRLRNEDNRLEMLKLRVEKGDPRTLLRSGYVIAMDGERRVLNSAATLSKGTSLQLMFADGQADVEVMDVQMRADGEGKVLEKWQKVEDFAGDEI